MGTNSTLPKIIREMMPEWCTREQCSVIKQAMKERREKGGTLEVIMQIKWETDIKCLRCQDPEFKEMLNLLDVHFGSGKSKSKKKERRIR